WVKIRNFRILKAHRQRGFKRPRRRYPAGRRAGSRYIQLIGEIPAAERKAWASGKVQRDPGVQRRKGWQTPGGCCVGPALSNLPDRRSDRNKADLLARSDAPHDNRNVRWSVSVAGYIDVVDDFIEVGEQPMRECVVTGNQKRGSRPGRRGELDSA